MKADAISPVPSLDQLAAEPGAVSQLPLQVVEALLGRLLVAQGALLGRLLAARAAVASGDGQPTAQEDRLLCIPEVAVRLAIPRGRVYEFCRRGELPVIRLGKYIRVRASALSEWLAHHEEKRVERTTHTVYSKLPSGGRHDRRTTAKRP